MKTFPHYLQLDAMDWPHLPADDSQILRQELFAADAPRALLHHTRGGIHAGHQ